MHVLLAHTGHGHGVATAELLVLLVPLAGLIAAFVRFGWRQDAADRRPEPTREQVRGQQGE